MVSVVIDTHVMVSALIATILLFFLGTRRITPLRAWTQL